MLTEFKVKGFKNFENELVFNLQNAREYSFNPEAVRDGVVKTGLIYGANGSGKSNIGYAIFDVIHHLTDKMPGTSHYVCYKNLNTRNDDIEFAYTFRIMDSTVVYRYTKISLDTVVKETVSVDDVEVIHYDRKDKGSPIVNLKGAETLNVDLFDKKMSFVKFVKSNTQLADNTVNGAFRKFLEFVDGMLFFASLEGNDFMGFSSVKELLSDRIVESGTLEVFQEFLCQNGVSYQLEKAKSANPDQKWDIRCRFKNGTVDIFSIASRGTVSLMLLFYWLVQMKGTKGTPSFVFIDEFDSFYHSDATRHVVDELKRLDMQVLLTTHDQTIMDNDLLRPDCYFTLDKGKIAAFSEMTTKDIRVAHNLQKMYAGGMFREP
jgi:AAA15 family ATPase/GTPase